MKKLSLLLVLMAGFVYAQMPDVSKVWLNKSEYYKGTIADNKTPLKIRFFSATQDQKNDQEYFVSGQAAVDANVTNLEGKLKIKKYKNGKKKGKVYGEYELLEEPNGKHTGVFKGKFVYTFTWNDKEQTIINHSLIFKGDWMSYDQTLKFKTKWDNHD